MNFLEIYYTAIARYYNTDYEGAKKIIEEYIIELKNDIDNSNDEYLKELWLDEFQNKTYPTADDFLSTIFLFGENPFKFSK